MKHNEAISDDSSEWHDYRELLSQGEYEKGHDKTIPGDIYSRFSWNSEPFGSEFQENLE